MKKYYIFLIISFVVLLYINKGISFENVLGCILFPFVIHLCSWLGWGAIFLLGSPLDKYDKNPPTEEDISCICNATFVIITIIVLIALIDETFDIEHLPIIGDIMHFFTNLF